MSRSITTLIFLVLFPTAVFAVQGTMLIYRQQENGVAPYNDRIMVTKNYLRMDDGDDNGDYLIFDRKQGVISSVTHADETVLEIPPRKVSQRPPMKLDRRGSEIEMGEVPLIAGRKPQHRQLYVNDKSCYNVVAVEGLLGDALKALVAFRNTLAGEHAKLLPRLPADQQDPCDLARNIFYPAWQLEFGLPIQEWDEQGKGQVLVDFKQGVEFDTKLFTLPKGYRHYTTDDML